MYINLWQIWTENDDIVMRSSFKNTQIPLADYLKYPLPWWHFHSSIKALKGSEHWGF